MHREFRSHWRNRFGRTPGYTTRDARPPTVASTFTIASLGGGEGGGEEGGDVVATVGVGTVEGSEVAMVVVRG